MPPRPEEDRSAGQYPVGDTNFVELRVYMLIDSMCLGKRRCVCKNDVLQRPCPAGGLAPLIIFKGQNLVNTWIPLSLVNAWHFSCNDKGWTSNIN